MSAATLSNDKTKQAKWGSAPAYVLLIVATALVCVPIFWFLKLSVTAEAEYISPGLSILPQKWYWNNYVEAVTSTAVLSFWTAVRNSAILALVYSTLTVLSSAMAGFAFARIPAPGRKQLFAIVIALLMVPTIVFIVPQFILFSSLRLTNSYWPWVLWGIAANPFYIFLFRQFFMSFPKELEDAAEVDGAGKFRFFWQILLPNSQPVLAASFILAFIFVWNDWFQPMIYLQPQKTTMAVKLLTGYNNPQGFPYITYQMAAAVLFTLPLVVMFFLAQKYIMQGVVTSGLKG